MELHVRNVNQALNRGIMMMKTGRCEIVSPRGSPTIEWPEPVTTHYAMPRERVLFSPTRDANPFFHFFEALWMLAGRDDVEFVARLLPRMKEFSDDGLILPGAYGFRWRRMWFDQLVTLVHLLKREPDTRRAVLAMWAPMELYAGAKSKDVPCNTQVYFKLRDGQLRMTVTCRSNDMLWGAYGANAVHFSMLQEYMADKLGADVGTMTQLSDSFHIYTTGPGGELWNRVRNSADEVREHDYYTNGEAEPYAMDATLDVWDTDLHRFFKLVDQRTTPVAEDFETDYFKLAVVPMWLAWSERNPDALKPAVPMDWAIAGIKWLERRIK